ncbi:MAG: TonB-dependent receptor plug domain-containing protein, partial [Methylococcales bacterium]|nr:TonB-dependent receptor plug domain-containing protein [Methylococcales bacterium]
DQRLTIVVTGSRTAQTVDETLAPVTVIDRKQIEESNATTVNEVLRATPGLSLTTNGGEGSNTSIFLRGTESDHTLVLLDGIRISSATSGTASLQDIPLSQIERIEIVRGPRSSLYGSDAIGGVIQIFTRKPQAGQRTDLALSAGSHSSRGLNAGFAKRMDKGWFSVHAATYETDGFDACRGEAATQFGGCFSDEPDDDGYQNDSLSLAGGVSIGSKTEASFNFLRADSELDFDGSTNNSRDSSNQLIGTKLNIAAMDNWGVVVTAASNEDHSDNFNQGEFSSQFNTDRKQYGIQNDIYAGQSGLITFGVDYFDDKVSGTTEYAVTNRDNTGIYAQYQGDYG